jgi:hypothetical protein
MMDSKKLSVDDDEWLQASHQDAQTAQVAGLNAVTHARPIDIAADETGILEHFQVLRNRGLCHGKLIDQLAAHAGFTVRQDAQDADADGVADGLGKRGKLFVGIIAFNRSQVRRGVGWCATGSGVRVVGRTAGGL